MCLCQHFQWDSKHKAFFLSWISASVTCSASILVCVHQPKTNAPSSAESVGVNESHKNAILFIRVIEWIRFSDVCMPWCGKYFIQNYVHISNKAFRCKTNKLMTVIPSQVEFNPFDYLTFCVTSEVPKKKSWHRKNAHYCVVEQRDKTSPIFRTELYRKMRFMSGSV